MYGEVQVQFRVKSYFSRIRGQTHHGTSRDTGQMSVRDFEMTTREREYKRKKVYTLTRGGSCANIGGTDPNVDATNHRGVTVHILEVID